MVFVHLSPLLIHREKEEGITNGNDAAEDEAGVAPLMSVRVRRDEFSLPHRKPDRKKKKPLFVRFSNPAWVIPEEEEDGRKRQGRQRSERELLFLLLPLPPPPLPPLPEFPTPKEAFFLFLLLFLATVTPSSSLTSNGEHRRDSLFSPHSRLWAQH